MFIEIASRSVLPNGGGPMLTTRPLQYLDPSALADRASNEGVVRGSMAAAEAMGKGISGAGAAIGGGLQDMGKQKMQKEAYDVARKQQGFENEMAQRSASQRDSQLEINKQSLGTKEEQQMYRAATGIFKARSETNPNYTWADAVNEASRGGQPQPQNGIDIWRSNLNQSVVPTPSSFINGGKYTLGQ